AAAERWRCTGHGTGRAIQQKRLSARFETTRRDNVLRIRQRFPYNPKVFRFDSSPCIGAHVYSHRFSEEMGMNRTPSAARRAVIAALSLSLGVTAWAQSPATGQDAPQGKQPYTMAEYNSYQACANDTNPASQVKCFDDFVAKYPNSALLIYVYPKYVESYGKLKDYRKVIESADKVLSLGDKIDGPTKYSVLSTRAQAYAQLVATDKAAAADANLAKGEVDAVGQALKYLEEVKKPEGMTDDQFAAEKVKIKTFLNGVGAQAAGAQKDSAKQIEFYKAVLANNPDDVVTNYQLGKVYLAMQPPQSMD